MATISPASLAGASSAKSTKQAALDDALATVKSAATGKAGSAIAAQLRDQNAAVAQQKLGQAQERYKLLRETMLTVLRAGGEPRSAARLARDAASLARDVAKAVKDIGAAARGGDAATAEARRASLDGVHKESRKLLSGMRTLIDAARVVNEGSGRGGLQKNQRAKEISQARRDAEAALASVTREISSARLAAGSRVAISV